MPKLDLGYVRGPQGEPGYTPIKGVDYFDGKDGQDGKDGYTPVKGVDYFDGKDGTQGPAGKDGSDYVLTDADKQEIAGMVEGNDVAVDGTTIIQNADGTISTAVGGYAVPGEEMFRWEGSLASEASAAIDISVFENEIADMDGDTVTISFVLDDEEYEEKYDISYDKKSAEIVFENTKADLTAIVVNLDEETISVEHEGDNLTSLVISSATSYETINPNFIPVGRGLRRTSSAITIDDSYIENIIDEAGGSVAIDGVTIIENEDGEICAAIGGGKELQTPAQTVFEYEDQKGTTHYDEGYSRFDVPSGTNFINSLDKSKKYNVYMECYNASDSTTEECEGYIVYEQDTYGVMNWTAYNLDVCGNEVTTFQNESRAIRIDVKSDAYYNIHFIRVLEIVSEPVYEYNQIDANYIKIGSGLTVNIDNELCTTIGGLEMINNNTICSASNSVQDATKVINSVTLGSGNSIQKNQESDGAVAIGRSNKVYGNGVAAFGEGNTVNQWGAVAVGCDSKAQAMKAFTAGVGLTTSTAEQTVYGKYNQTASGYNVIIGNGADFGNKANGLTIDASGNVVTQGTISNAGADYAEYFEWADSNPNAEDRVGLLVALDGNKIRLAQPGDDVLGIVSGTATVLGDDAEWAWQGKYLRDEFGRLIMEEIELYDEDGQVSGHTMAPKINPNYDKNKEYISRAKRAEWDAIGMMGKLFVRDDGTCQVNGYATVAANGLASSSVGKTNMRVMERISANIVRVCMK